MKTKFKVDDVSIKAELKQIEKNAFILQKIKNDLSNIGIDKIVSENELNAHLLKGTNYSNAKLIAELKNFDYSFYLENYNKVNESFYNADYTIKESIIKSINEKHTIYLTDEQDAIKIKLDKICEVMNSINSEYNKALYKSTITGKFETNLEVLIQIDNLIKSYNR
jgi:hypothetical protein